MVTPLTIHPEKPDGAVLEVESVFGESAVTSAFSRGPLKLLTPCARGRSVWICTSSFGGGLVAGDQTRLDLRLGKNARCFLGAQASTKIYRNPNQRPCGHATRAALGEHSLLVFAPDPVQAYAGSTYSQQQEFHLDRGAGLVLLDWFTSGRAARGERWEFSRFKSRNEVFIAGQRVFLDSIFLDSSNGSLASPMRAGRFNCFAMLLLVGDSLRAAAGQMFNKISAESVQPKSSLISSASAIHDGAILRVAGEQVEAVGREIRQHLAFLRDALGDDPWARKW